MKLIDYRNKIRTCTFQDLDIGTIFEMPRRKWICSKVYNMGTRPKDCAFNAIRIADINSRTGYMEFVTIPPEEAVIIIPKSNITLILESDVKDS